MAFEVPEKFRLKTGALGSDSSYGNNGVFSILIKNKCTGEVRLLHVIASDGEDWEHVSVSLPDRCPVWEEMRIMKDLFWGDEDTVIQIHPPKSDYVNNHQYCLHLWRPTKRDIPLPPSAMVGYKNV